MSESTDSALSHALLIVSTARRLPWLALLELSATKRNDPTPQTLIEADLPIRRVSEQLRTLCHADAFYQMNANVEKILITLRQAGMDWLASEIETAIRQGGTLWLHPQGTESGAPESPLSPQPLSDSEELKVAIAAIHAHLLDLRRVWSDSSETLIGTLASAPPPDSQLTLSSSQPYKVMLQETPSAPSVEPFVENTRAVEVKLHDLFRQAWPDGPSEYDQIFKQPSHS